MSTTTINALLPLALLCVGIWPAHTSIGRAIAATAHSTQHDALPSNALPSALHTWEAATEQHGPAQLAPVPDADDSHLWPQLPFVTADAVVTRPATAAEARAAYAAVRGDVQPLSSPDALGVASRWDGGGASGRGARALLHGRRHPSSYHKCPRCTIVECRTNPVTKRLSCTGHCRNRKVIFRCKAPGVSAGVCSTPLEERPDPLTLTPDALEPLESAVVTASTPFIGCANITGVTADACPARGVLGESQTLGRVMVLGSSCVQHLYTLPCAEEDDDDYSPRTPFFPFGYCRCLFVYGAGKLAVEPCKLSDFEESGPEELGSGEGGGVLRDPEEVPVRVYVDDERNVTVSEFGVREETDPGTYRLQHEFNTSSGNISVELRLFKSFPSPGVNLTAEGPLGEEEHGGGVGGGAASAEGPAAAAPAVEPDATQRQRGARRLRQKPQRSADMRVSGASAV